MTGIIFSRVAAWSLIVFACALLIPICYFASSTYPSDFTPTSSLEQPPIEGPRVSIEIEDFETSLGAVTISIIVSLPQSSLRQKVINNTVDVMVFQIYPSEYAPQRNLTMTNYGSIGLLGMATYVLRARSSSYLYPFDFYEIGLALTFSSCPPAYRPGFDYRFAADVGATWEIRQVRLSFEQQPTEYEQLYLILSRRYGMQLQSILPTWIIFVTMFIAASLDPQKDDGFRMRMTTFAALLIFMLSYSFLLPAGTASIIEWVRMSVLTVLVTFMATDIAVYHHKFVYAAPNSIVSAKRLKLRKVMRANDIPFIMCLVLLAFHVRNVVAIYSGTYIFALGPVYLLLFLVPALSLFVNLYYLKRPIWIVAAVACVLMESLVLGEVLRSFVINETIRSSHAFAALLAGI